MAIDEWDPLDEPTDAPVIGDVLDGFRMRLDENLSRLPGLAADAGTIAGYWVAAASVTGLGHLHHGLTGQDSYAFAGGTPCVTAAVTDGLGSRGSTAHLGAITAARLLCDELRDLNPRVRRGFRQQAASAIARVDQRLTDKLHRLWPNLLADDLATTAAFCSISRRDDRCHAVIGRIGDCAAFRLRGSEWRSIFPRGHGPANIVNAHLPGPTAAERAEIVRIRLDLPEVLILTTDELASDIFSSPDVRAWLAERWKKPVTIFHMLESLRYRRRGSHDDRTALVIWLTPTEEPIPSTDEGIGESA